MAAGNGAAFAEQVRGEGRPPPRYSAASRLSPALRGLVFDQRRSTAVGLTLRLDRSTAFEARADVGSPA
jgi:hypothetical protein